MQNYKLTVIVEPCEEGGYFARCLELQGCFAEAETYDEAMYLLKEYRLAFGYGWEIRIRARKVTGNDD